MNRMIETVAIAAFAVIIPITAQAADIHVLTPPNMQAILTALTPDFERSSGHKLIISYAPVPAVKDKVAAGGDADVAITLRPLIDDLQNAGKLKGAVDIGRSFIAVAVRTGAAKPNISTLDAFKRTLISAKSLAYSDPPKGGISGVYMARLIERLGLTEQLKPQTVLVPPGGGPLVEAVAIGKAEIGIDQLSSLINKPGIEVVGNLPKEADVDIVMAAGVTNSSAEPDAAQSLIQFLTSPAGAAVVKQNGMQPG
jgi:molybdate transport system substrate-binding protein